MLGGLSVAIVQGGPSSEAEVSRASASGVEGALLAAKHRVARLELDGSLPERLRRAGYDVVFPVAHGHVGEDGSLQGLLEVLDVPYVGSDVLASALAMEKRFARIVFEHAGLPIAPGFAAIRGDARATADRARREIGEALVVKPSSQGSAIGVTRLETGASAAEVARAIEEVWAIDDFAVVEHFAHGREVTCAVLDLNETLAFPPTEIFAPLDAFYTYEARYAPGRSRHVCPADLPAEVAARVRHVAVEAHRALGCRDLSRVDLIVGDGERGDAITLLEVNSLPGMTATSLYPECAAAGGWPMDRLCDALVARAHVRGTKRRSQARALPR
ncbi:MAG TPA: D-alanine--D-alanine ligase [Polyangiaceae bacterium]|nr:D-alanine--D-alanine ligase [Polyangiaceae bacterium]